MRNANIGDVLSLGLGKYLSNVVFLVTHPTFGRVKAHPVMFGQMIDADGSNSFMMETMSGEQFVAKLSWIGPVPRKLGTPAKPKRKPQKGTKPELANAVPYDFSLITDGCKVLTANGLIFTVDFSNSLGGEHYYLSSFDHKTGKNKHYKYFDIKKIILDKPLVKQESKPKYEKGVWYHWFGGDNPVGDAHVQYIMRDSKGDAEYFEDCANDLRWSWLSRNGDIIAFRII